MLSDDDLLLDFTDREEAMAEARAELEKYGDAYRFQLIAALSLQHQAAYLEELRAGDQIKGHEVRLEGYVEALRHIAENLRDGYYLPGNPGHDDTIEGREY